LTFFFSLMKPLGGHQAGLLLGPRPQALGPQAPGLAALAKEELVALVPGLVAVALLSLASVPGLVALAVLLSELELVAE
jgi:hypothetical protein